MFIIHYCFYYFFPRQSKITPALECGYCSFWWCARCLCYFSTGTTDCYQFGSESSQFHTNYKEIIRNNFENIYVFIMPVKMMLRPRIKYFLSTLEAGGIWRRNKNYSFWIYGWGKLGQENHIILVMSSFSKNSFFKMLSVHTKTQSRCFQAPFSWRIYVDSRPNRRKKAPFSNCAGVGWTGRECSVQVCTEWALGHALSDLQIWKPRVNDANQSLLPKY